MLKRCMALCFALLLCVSCLLLAACGGGDETTTTAVTTTTPTGGNPPESPVTLLDDRTYAGKTCVIWHIANNQCGPGSDLYVTEETADATALDRAALMRLQAIERRSGITYKTVVSTSQNSSGFGSSDLEFLRVLLGQEDEENVPDIVMPGAYTAFTLMGEGLFMDLRNDVPNIDLSKDCWDQEVNRALSFGVTDESEGYTYLASGTHSITNYRVAACLMVDRVVLDTINPANIDYSVYPELAGYDGIESIYDWVRNKEWTWNKCLALCEQFVGPTGDANGERYGISYQKTDSYPILMSSGKKVLVANDDTGGIPMLLLDDQATINAFSWISENVSHANNPVVFGWGNGSGQAIEGDPVFGPDHTILFNVMKTGSVQTCAAWRDGDRGFEFSVLPMPMVDYVGEGLGAAQEDYAGGTVGWWMHLTAIPAVCNDPAFSGFALQLLCEMGKTNWDPTNFNVTTIWDAYVMDGLQDKYAPSDEDIEMVKIVMDSLSVDMAGFSWFNGIKVWDELRGIYNAGATSWFQLHDRIYDPVTNAVRDVLYGLGIVE